jgi:class 3 adenylate cyclase
VPDDTTATGETARDAELGRFRSLSVLICDMVGSTDVRVRLGAEGERLVRLHESLARDAVAAHDGTVIKGLGDGAMAVFEAAGDAVAAGVRLQRGLDSLHRRGEATALEVRIGISAGDVSVGVEDCYGLPVAEAVRLCAEASAGEILAADVVRALARHGLETPLTPAGDLELRGLGEPVTAWRVDWRPRSGGWPGVPLPSRLSTPATGQFVGREHELTTTLGRLAPTYDRRVLLVAGEAGVGKSALAGEVARRLNASTGALVVHGGCDEELRPPYQPFVQALRHLVRHAPTATLESYVRRHGGDLAVLVPDLVDRLGRVPPPRTTADASDRYLLFAAVSGLIEEVVAETPLVVVLDDLHWADRGTLLLLKHVVTSGELPGLVVIGTFRDTEVEDGNGLHDLLAELHRFDGVHRVDLSGLAGDELGELAAGVLGTDAATLAAVSRAVHRETDGNPFFAIELLRHLRETGPNLAPSLVNLPPSVREVVRRRVRRLGDDVVRLLSTGSVLGAEFHLESVAELAGMHPDTALDLIETAVTASVLREVPGQSKFRFVHALVQHTLYDDLSQTRRRRLHRAAAEAKERIGSTSTSAAHWLAAGDLADPLRAVAACTAAADEALLARAPDEAAGWYASALELIEDGNDLQLQCELRLRLGEAQRLAGDPAHRPTLAAAAALARRLGDAERMARAALAKTRWFSSSVGTANEEQLELLEAALAAIGPEPSATRARLLATLVAELVYSDRAEERYAIADEALAVARAVGDPDALFEVLFWRNTAAQSMHTDSGGDETEVAELAELAANGNDPLRQAMADLVIVLRGLECGQPHAADGPLARATRLAEELRLPVLQWLVTVLRGTRAAVGGFVGDAEKLAIEALELSQATDQPDASTWFGVQLYMVRYDQGRLGDLVDMSHAAIARAPRLYTWHAALVMALTELDRFEEAQAIVDELLDADYPGRRAEPHWLIGMGCLGSAVAAIGDTAAAARVYTALLPRAGRWASIMPLSLGSIDRVLGELASSLGWHDEAEQHFRAAITSNDAGPAPGFGARSRLGLMNVLAARGGPGDAAEIEQLTSEVRGILDRHDLARVALLLDTFAAAHPVGEPAAYPSVPAQASALLHVDEP